MSVVYCLKCDVNVDSDFFEACPSCETPVDDILEENTHNEPQFCPEHNLEYTKSGSCMGCELEYNFDEGSQIDEEDCYE